MNIQTFRTPTGDEMVIVERKVFDVLCRAAKIDPDAIEADEMIERVSGGAEETLPADMVKRMLDGESPVKLWREHRGMTQDELASAARMNPVYLSQIERKVRGGSTKMLQKLAAVLRVDLDDLVVAPAETEGGSL